MPICEHCLIEFPAREAVTDDAGHEFCCGGCQRVYDFINDQGFSAFYRRRNWDAPGLPTQGVPENVSVKAFSASVREVDGTSEMDIYLDGIRCATCVWLVERVLNASDDVSIRVNYATHKALLKWDADKVLLEDILKNIYASGYTPKPYTESEAIKLRNAEKQDLLVRFGTAAFLSSQLMLYSVALYAGYFQGMDAGLKLALGAIALLLCTPIIFYSGMPILKSAFLSLGRFYFNMDSLIALGACSAYLYSIYGLLTGGEVYFDTAAMIITLILLGRYIELSAREKASSTIDRLAGLLPQEAELVREDGGREQVLVGEIEVGMNIAVKPGEKFPLDGVIANGATEVDESLITGESIPVYKGSGSEVIGGSQNLYGSVTVRVARVGRDSVLSGIIRAVEEAQAAKPDIQRVADRVVGVFVPIIMLLAFLTVLGYYIGGAPFSESMMVGISVLVISCPCSLGLATPLAVLVYTIMASSKGLLVKNGQSAEVASKIRHVIFDKTGTLTTGKQSLEEVILLDDMLKESEALRIAASVEMLSEHPLSKAILSGARAMLEDFTPAEVDAFRAIPGRGVVARASGKDVVVGNLELMAESGIPVNESQVVETKGNTALYMGFDGKAVAVFLISDTLRAEAPEAVEMLKGLGCDISVVSGDAPETVSEVSKRAGIMSSVGSALPDDKRQIVKAKQAGEWVMMVGDGINDAPALTEASVGVAMARGTDIAMESADAVIMNDDLRLVPYFIGLSGRAFQIIRQNIFWAFFYNIVAIPLAIMGILHPIVAAGAMAASSLVVVGNSLRLRKFQGR
jgi:Cu2+-exporting ATPase